MGLLPSNNVEVTKRRTNIWVNIRIDKVGIQKIELGSTLIILIEKQSSSAMKRKDPAIHFPS